MFNKRKLNAADLKPGDTWLRPGTFDERWVRVVEFKRV